MKIRDKVKECLLLIIYIFSKVVNILFPNKKAKSNAIILAPSWHGSIGDEAVIDSISFQLKNKNINTTLIHYGNSKEWSYLKNIDQWYSIPNYFKTGGWKDHLKLIFLFRKHSFFYAMGTDMMDGCYADWLTNGIIKITNQAAYSGLKTTIVGFSLNSWHIKEVVRNLSNMHKTVRYCLRDNISLQRFKEIAPQKTTELTTDMAFLLKPTLINEDIKKVYDWINLEKEKGSLVIGININPQLFDDEAKVDSLILSSSEALLKIEKANKKIKFILIPHDFREYNSDLELLKKLKEKLDKCLTSGFKIIDKPFLASDMKGLVENFDLVITARMHLAIACLGQTIPIGCLVYQGKFEGLFNHFSLDRKYMLDPNKALIQDELTSFIQQIIDERLLIKESIIKQLPSVKKKSFANLSI